MAERIRREIKRLQKEFAFNFLWIKGIVGEFDIKYITNTVHVRIIAKKKNQCAAVNRRLPQHTKIVAPYPYIFCC